MDSDALKTFLAIHRANGFSNAGDALGRSQPAISRRIAQLEAELGAPLFGRVAGGAVLSQAGRVLLPHAERVMAALQDASDAVNALRAGHAGPVSLAVVGTLASTKLTSVLKTFAARLPDVALQLSTATSAEISDQVRRGEATIGLRYFEDNAPDLVCEHLGGETMRVICAPSHRLAGKRVKHLTDLKAERWFAFPAVPGRREASAQLLHVQFLMRGVADFTWTPADSLTAQKRLVEAGFGIALIQESSIQEERAAGALATISVGDLAAENPVYAIMRKDGYLSGAAKALLEELKRRKFL